jgi:hypothetical protein
MKTLLIFIPLFFFQASFSQSSFFRRQHSRLIAPSGLSLPSPVVVHSLLDSSPGVQLFSLRKTVSLTNGDDGAESRTKEDISLVRRRGLCCQGIASDTITARSSRENFRLPLRNDPMQMQFDLSGASNLTEAAGEILVGVLLRAIFKDNAP